MITANQARDMAALIQPDGLAEVLQKVEEAAKAGKYQLYVSCPKAAMHTAMARLTTLGFSTWDASDSGSVGEDGKPKVWWECIAVAW